MGDRCREVYPKILGVYIDIGCLFVGGVEPGCEGEESGIHLLPISHLIFKKGVDGVLGGARIPTGLITAFLDGKV